jgi:cell division protein FtsZ
MGEELKVTVVATGLGEDDMPNVVVDNTVAQQALDGQVDYSQLDRPAFARNQASAPSEGLADEQDSQDLDYLDIPAFLRRQAD